MAEKKDVTPLDVEAEEMEVYEEQFRSALDSLKTDVVEEKKVQIAKSERVRHYKRFPKSNRAKKTSVVTTKNAAHRRRRAAKMTQKSSK